MPQHDEARVNREDSEPFVETEPQAPTDPAATGQAAPDADEPARVALGPLGAFFKREAEFYRQEAMNFAILLEKASQHGK